MSTWRREEGRRQRPPGPVRQAAIERDPRTDRPFVRQTDRQSGRQTERRQTDRQAGSSNDDDSRHGGGARAMRRPNPSSPTQTDREPIVVARARARWARVDACVVIVGEAKRVPGATRPRARSCERSFGGGRRRPPPNRRGAEWERPRRGGGGGARFENDDALERVDLDARVEHAKAQLRRDVVERDEVLAYAYLARWGRRGAAARRVRRRGGGRFRSEPRARGTVRGEASSTAARRRRAASDDSRARRESRSRCSSAAGRRRARAPRAARACRAAAAAALRNPSSLCLHGRGTSRRRPRATRRAAGFARPSSGGVSGASGLPPGAGRSARRPSPTASRRMVRCAVTTNIQRTW